MKHLFCAVSILSLASAVPAFATVAVNSPANGATVSSNVQYVANANTSSCSRGIAATGVYVDDVLRYVANGPSLNAAVQMSAGPHRTVVQAWDFCGGATSSTVNVTVSTGGGGNGVAVSSPVNGSTVGSPAPFNATASSSCPQGVTAMGIYVDDQLAFVTQGSNLNTQLSMGTGKHKTVVQSWDNCGGSNNSVAYVTVGGGGGSTFYNVQASGGWNQWGELAPVYDICTASQCPGVNWSMNQHVNSPSLSGNATRFNLGGSTPYSDALFSNPLIGYGSTQGLPDQNQTILQNVHDLTYDTQVFVTNFAVTQDLEFDVNIYMNSVGMEWGMQCNHLDHGVWDYWDTAQRTWLPTSVPCSLNNNSWNHVSFQAHRNSNNDVVYQTLTVNGVTSNINVTVAPFQIPSDWYGMTVNYQMDGDYKQNSNTTYVDNLNISYQ